MTQRTLFEARASTILYRIADGIPDSAGVHLLPANVCPVVPLALLAADRSFEFVDLDPLSLHMSVDGLAERLADSQRRSVASVIWVRTYGAPSDGPDDLAWLKKMAPRAVVIDDRCLCLPGSLDPDSLGAADALVYSSGRAKPADLGYGGVAIVADGLVCPPARRTYRQADLDLVTQLYSAAIADRRPLYTESDGGCMGLLASLGWLDCREPRISWPVHRERMLVEADKKRRHTEMINRIYSHRLPEEVQLARRMQTWRFSLRVRSPDVLVADLFRQGFWASRHYYPASRLFGDDAAPVAEALHAEVVNLGNGPGVSCADAERICDVVCRHLDIVAGGGVAVQ